MNDAIADAVVLRKWASLADDPRLSESNKSDMLRGFLKSMADECSLLKAISAELTRMSEPAAVRARAAITAASKR